MIVAGWGKGLRPIGYWGILKCSNCKNYTHFNLCELSNNIKLYFITVAKYNKKKYLVCPVCECGFDVTEEKFSELIEKMPQRFDKEKTEKIWEFVDAEFTSINADQLNNINNYISNIKAKLVSNYGNEENLSEIIYTYFQYISDDDKAR